MNWDKLKKEHYFADPVEHVVSSTIFPTKEYDTLYENQNNFEKQMRSLLANYKTSLMISSIFSFENYFEKNIEQELIVEPSIDDIKENNDRNEVVVVSPDVGGVVRSRALAKLLDDTDLAIIDKRRAAANQSEVMNIIGEVQGKVCIVPDDIIDTAGTLCNAAEALKNNGAKAVKAYITHPVLSGPAIERLNKSAIDELVVTNSIPLDKEAKKCSKIRVISIANIIAECITRLSNEESLSEMFL